jgi:hypothetical protein
MPKRRADTAEAHGAFETPGEIVRSSTLSRNEKINLLHNWETDLRELLVAYEEGMGQVGADRTAELLREVRVALNSFGAAEESSGVRNKAGQTPFRKLPKTSM